MLILVHTVLTYQSIKLAAATFNVFAAAVIPLILIALGVSRFVSLDLGRHFIQDIRASVPPLLVMSEGLPSLFPLIWLLLYAGSGFLLKAARRFDIGFQWFNRHADIEKKPLQSIGLVAGVLVAVVYWAGVVVSRMFSDGRI